MMRIDFNKPYFTGKETDYILQAVQSEKISGDGMFTKKCHAFFENRYNFLKTLLTTSCTDALEMAAILLNINEGDEVIAPSYTFVSTVNAFVLRGAKIVFADSMPHHPNMDAMAIESLITSKTKVILPVHYAGVACEMDTLVELGKKYQLHIVEDAAQAIDSYYKDRPIGSIGSLAAFSFHETKNIISGEGGMLVVNDKQFLQRAEIIREKGTNRSAFFRGEVDKYGWVDVGSSFLPSDIIAAFLYAQVENIEAIQQKRVAIWNHYNQRLQPMAEQGYFTITKIPDYATNNAHMFYIVCNILSERTGLIKHLKEKNINAVFHYLSLHKSEFYNHLHDGRKLIHADRFTDCLLRLPMYFELTEDQVNRVCDEILRFYKS